MKKCTVAQAIEILVGEHLNTLDDNIVEMLTSVSRISYMFCKVEVPKNTKQSYKLKFTPKSEYIDFFKSIISENSIKFGENFNSKYIRYINFLIYVSFNDKLLNTYVRYIDFGVYYRDLGFNGTISMTPLHIKELFSTIMEHEDEKILLSLID